MTRGADAGVGPPLARLMRVAADVEGSRSRRVGAAAPPRSILVRGAATSEPRRHRGRSASAQRRRKILSLDRSWTKTSWI